MATAYTASDALGLYLSGTLSATGCGTAEGCLGGRMSTEWNTLEPIIENPIGPVVVESVSAQNGTGTGYIRAASTTTLAYTAPGDTEGTAATVAANTHVLLQSGTAAKSVRVYRDSVYNSNVLGGRMRLDYVPGLNNVIAMSDVSNADRVAGEDFYRAIYLHNHSPGTISNVKVYIGTLATTRTTATAQLSSSGSGTITTATANGFADWPDAGWAHVKTNAPATREIVYYTSRTSTALTVPAAGRALLGTSASAGAADDTVESVGSLRCGLETPAAKAIQTIADTETAPSGITWNTGTTSATGLSHTTLLTGESVGLWFHKQIPAGATVAPEQTTKIVITFDYSATTYTNTISGYYRIANTDLALYKLFVGVDADPDFGGSSVATSATLPFTYVVTPPGSGTDELRCAVMQTNQYGLNSFNSAKWYNTFTINTSGADITEELTDPSGVTAVAKPGGEVDVTATYLMSQDDDPADTWLFYTTTSGTDPDPNTDTPTEVTMSYSGFARPVTSIKKVFGPYAYGTTFKVIARVKRASDSAESANTTVVSETVDTQKPVQANWVQKTGGGYRGFSRQASVDSYTYYDDPTNACYIRMIPGAAGIHCNSGEWALRGETGSTNVVRVPADWDFYEQAHSASGTATALEKTSSTDVYINVNGTRRAKLDFSNNRIEAATFILTETLESLPVIGPTHMTSTATYLQIFHPVTGRWQPWLKVSSAGVLTLFGSMIQD